MATLLARHEADGADFLDGEAKQLLPDLYYLGDFQGHAVYGFFASSKFFLVDAPGGPGLLPFLENRLEQLGRKAVKPAAVLLTSCDVASVAGLGDLVQACHPEVIVAALGLHKIKECCPPGTAILSAEKLADRGWFEINTLPLRGRGLAPIAYRVRWAGKTVLFSGRIPIAPQDQNDTALLAEISKSPTAALDYLVSVYRLGDPRPDLWLPAFPVDGQNANLYDKEWQAILNVNYRVGYHSLSEQR